MATEHRCLAYAKESDLRAATRDFLSEGATRGEQVGYFGWGGDESLRGRIGGLDGLDGLIRRGAARVASFDARFRRDEAPDPVELVSFWSDATDAALGAGFSGLCAVADTTPWVRRPQQRTAFLRGEQLVDRYRLDHPFALLCVLDASTLAAEAVAETACIHPVAEGVSPPFHLHATEHADLAVHGEMDAYTVSLLELVLVAAPPVPNRRDLVIDATGLEFIEHRSLLALERHAERAGVTTIRLRNASRTVDQIAKLLDLRRVRVEDPR